MKEDLERQHFLSLARSGNSNSENVDDYMTGQRQGMKDASEGKVAKYSNTNIKNNMAGGRRKTRSRKGKSHRGKTRRN